MPVDASWYQGLLTELDVPTAKQPAALSMLKAWGTVENVNPAYNNPFGIIKDGRPARFATPAEGQAATADLLSRGYYRGITAGLRQGRPDYAIAILVRSPWNGSGHYGAQKKAGLGYDWTTSSVYRVWRQQGGSNSQGVPALNPTPAQTPWQAVSQLASVLSGRDLWVRLGEGAAGVVLCAVGIGLLAGIGPGGTAANLAKLVGKNLGKGATG